jgi:hypothetical protein
MTKRKVRSKRGAGIESDTVVAIAWYRADQWDRLRATSAVPDELEDTHAEWHDLAERKLKELRELGVNIERVEIDVDQLVTWCADRGRPVDGAARADHAAELLWRKYNPGKQRPL